MQRFTISIVCFISYGMRVASLDDPLVIAQETADECKPFVRCSLQMLLTGFSRFDTVSSAGYYTFIHF